jgi:hypothetical protein
LVGAVRSQREEFSTSARIIAVMSRVSRRRSKKRETPICPVSQQMEGEERAVTICQGKSEQKKGLHPSGSQWETEGATERVRGAYAGTVKT